MAMILAVAALLHYAGDTTAAGDDAPAEADPGPSRLRAVYEAVLETVATGTRTPDLGGHTGTTEFTDAVIEAIRRKLK